MHNVRKIADETWYIGVNDNQTNRFEKLHSLPEGVTYNSYLRWANLPIRYGRMGICWAIYRKY